MVFAGMGIFLAKERPAPEKEKSATLVFVGDIMLSRHIGKIIEAHGPTYPFELIAPFTAKADLAFANLENPVSTRGTHQGSIYSFRANPSALQGLQFAGFDVVSIANNHLFDWGLDAFTDTLSHLKKYNILFAGGGMNQEEANAWAVKRINGAQYCFLAYTQFASRFLKEGEPGMAFLKKEKVLEAITQAKEKGACNAVIISIHWGNEYETAPFPEQKVLARSFIDGGALLVIGHHPHVAQEVEEYKDGLIAYSLGNFVFDQNFSPDTRRGLVLSVEAKGGKVVKFEKTTINFNDTFQPYIPNKEIKP